MSIPLRLHMIWLGPKKMPIKWMASWRRLNPSMEYCLHTGGYESDLVDKLIERGEYRGASDIMRVHILKEHGGVYTDVDSVCLKPIEDAPFMQSDFFVAGDYDHSRNKVKDWVANGTIGSVSNHPLLDEYLDIISRISPDDWWQIGGMTLTSLVKKYDVTILPTCTFYPTNWKGETALKEGEVYARHIWASTKGRYE